MEVLLDNGKLILAFFLGIGLAASAGFRVFLPLFALSLAARFGFDLNADWEWVGSWTAIITLGVATIVEIGAYYIPWIDNILDAMAVPLAGIAGTLLMALSLGDVDSQVLQWGLAIIAGGGTASAVKGSAASTRLASTASTGGAGNFIISSTETAAASVLSVTAIIFPIVGFILVLVVFYYMYKGYRYIQRRRASKGLRS